MPIFAPLYIPCNSLASSVGLEYVAGRFGVFSESVQVGSIGDASRCSKLQYTGCLSERHFAAECRIFLAERAVNNLLRARLEISIAQINEFVDKSEPCAFMSAVFERNVAEIINYCLSYTITWHCAKKQKLSFDQDLAAFVSVTLLAYSSCANIECVLKAIPAADVARQMACMERAVPRDFKSLFHANFHLLLTERLSSGEYKLVATLFNRSAMCWQKLTTVSSANSERARLSTDKMKCDKLFLPIDVLEALARQDTLNPTIRQFLNHQCMKRLWPLLSQAGDRHEYEPQARHCFDVKYFVGELVFKMLFGVIPGHR